MSKDEYNNWEDVCIQCGLCCLIKQCTAKGEVFLTRVLCDHLDKDTRKCGCYSADYDQRDALDGGCVANNGARVNMYTLKNDYVVPGCCPYVKKFVGENNLAMPDIDFSGYIHEKDMAAGDSLGNHIIPGSENLFEYNPLLNIRLRESLCKLL